MRENIDLCGAWDFCAETDAGGFTQNYPAGAGPFERKINVPGCWQAQGVGEPAAYLRHSFNGWGWYRREIEVPENWLGGRVWLHIGGACETTRAFVNGRDVGSHYGFSTPFKFDATDALKAGKNTLVIAVSNLPKSGKRLRPGEHENDPTGCFVYHARWGGIYRAVWLENTAQTWIEDVYAIPQINDSKLIVEIELGGAAAAGKSITAVLAGRSASGTANAAGKAVLEIHIDDLQHWSPEEPVLHELKVRLIDGQRPLDERLIRVGLRQITVSGDKILLNGRPCYLAGYGDDCVEPLTGFPPADKEVYRQRLRMMKSCGFNAVRHHSWVPLAEYFEAADEVGMLVQAELPAAYPRFLIENTEFLKAKLPQVIRAHRNHASFATIGLGNEFFNHCRPILRSIKVAGALEELYALAKTHYRTGLVLATAGEHLNPSDFDEVILPTSVDEKPLVRINNVSPTGKPVIAHEFGGYTCALPRVDEIAAFTGVIRPTWLESKSRWVEQSGWADLYPRTVENSQRMLHLRRKTEMEHARQQSNASGYHWWLGHDYPAGAEGDAWYQGIVDFFWQPKSFQPEEMRPFNGPTVLALDVPPPLRNCWDEVGCRGDLLLSHYGAQDITGGVLAWRLVTSAGRVLKEAQLPVSQRVGTVRLLARIDIGQFGIVSPETVKLEARVQWPGGAAENGWAFTVFPKLAGPAADPAIVRAHPALISKAVRTHYPALGENDANAKVLICHSDTYKDGAFDAIVTRFLARGGRVLFLAEDAGLPTQRDRNFWQDIGMGYGSFILDHPALAKVPKREYCDELYMRLLGPKAAVLLDGMPREFRPIIGGVMQVGAGHEEKDKRLEKFGAVLEGTFGGGQVLLCTLRVFTSAWDVVTAPECCYLIESLAAYAASDQFQPRHDLTPLLKARS